MCYEIIEAGYIESEQDIRMIPVKRFMDRIAIRLENTLERGQHSQGTRTVPTLLVIKW